MPGGLSDAAVVLGLPRHPALSDRQAEQSRCYLNLWSCKGQYGVGLTKEYVEKRTGLLQWGWKLCYAFIFRYAPARKF
jgi:hypothetical protein